MAQFGRCLAVIALVLFVVVAALVLLRGLPFADVLNCLSATRSAPRLGVLRNRWLLGGIPASLALQGAVLRGPPPSVLLHTVPIPPADLLPIVAVATTVLWTEELRKLFVRRRRPRPR